MVRLGGILITLLGCYWIIKGNISEGLLILILGELVDLEYRIGKILKQ